MGRPPASADDGLLPCLVLDGSAVLVFVVLGRDSGYGVTATGVAEPTFGPGNQVRGVNPRESAVGRAFVVRIRQLTRQAT